MLSLPSDSGQFTAAVIQKRRLARQRRSVLQILIIYLFKLFFSFSFIHKRKTGRADPETHPDFFILKRKHAATRHTSRDTTEEIFQKKH